MTPRSSLSFDAEALGRLTTTLAGVRSAFEAADSVACSPEHLGHTRLSGRVESFSTSWNDTRRELAESIGGLGTSATSIAEGFAEADEGLAAAFAGDEATS